MNDRVTNTAKLVSEFDGTLESADKILDRVAEIRAEVRREIDVLMKELNAIDTLADYILTKRNELAHQKKPGVRTNLIMTSKQERVEAVLDAAKSAVEDGIPIFNTDDIQRQLQKSHIDLDVSYPAAVIATILTGNRRFRKSSAGLYEYIGKERK